MNVSLISQMKVFIPGLIGTGQSFTTLNWAYGTVPQVNLNNRTLTVNAGKALGGSTIINSMIFVCSSLITFYIISSNYNPSASSGERTIRRMGNSEQRLNMDLGRSPSLLQEIREVHPSQRVPSCQWRSLHPFRARILWKSESRFPELLLHPVDPVETGIHCTGVPCISRLG